MNSSINLMPSRCRESLGRRRVIRTWIVVYCCTFAVMWSAYLLARAGRGSLIAERNALAAEVQQNWDRNEAAQRLVTEITEVETRIERYTELAWPVRMWEVISEIAAVTPESVTLTGLTVTPREETIDGGAKRGSKGSRPETRTLLLVEIEGVVSSDMEAATMVSGLDTHPLFDSVVLDYSKPRDVDGVEARAFRTTCRVNMSKRYSFTDAGTEAGP